MRKHKVDPVLPTTYSSYSSQGQLIEQLLSGINKNDFTLRLLRALSGKERASARGSLSTEPSNPATVSPGSQLGVNPSNQATSETAPVTSQSSISNATQFQSPEQSPEISSNTQPLPSSRTTNSTADRSKPREQETTTMTPTTAPATTEPSTTSGARSRENYAQQQVQRKREAKQERERVLRLLENDRMERKEREERRKAQVHAERQDAANLSSPLPSASSLATTKQEFSTPSSTAPTARCALQVRLLNGNKIRSTFPSSTTLTPTIRAWIDSSRTDGDTPYTLKQIMAPLPSRALTDTDEPKSCADLQLTPSATLVLVPVKKFAHAFGGRGGGQDSQIAGYVTSIITAIFDTVYSLIGYGAQTSGATSTTGSTQQASEERNREESTTTDVAATGGQTIRVRTLRDQRAEQDDRQFYNGNQVSVPLLLLLLFCFLGVTGQNLSLQATVKQHTN